MKRSLDKRKELKRAMQDGETITAVAERFSVSRPTVLEELKRGLTKEGYANRKYEGYCVGDAILNYWIEKSGDTEPGETIIEMLKANERRKHETINNQ